MGFMLIDHRHPLLVAIWKQSRAGQDKFANLDPDLRSIRYLRDILHRICRTSYIRTPSTC